MKKIFAILFAYTPLILLLALISVLVINIINGNAFNINYVDLFMKIVTYLFSTIIKPSALILDSINSLFKYVLYGLFGIIIWQLFIMKIPKLFNGFFTILGLFLKHFISYFSNRDSKSILFKTYLSFLKIYTKKQDLKNIYESHKLFFSNVFNSEFQIKDENIALFKTPFELKPTFEIIQGKLRKFIGKNNYIRKNIIFIPDEYISFYINKGDFTGEQLKQRLLEIKNEILLLLNNNFLMDINLINDTDVKIDLIKENMWTIKDLNFDNIDLKKGDILFGFYPSLIRTGIIYKNYILNTSKLIHSFVIGATRSGKDIFMLNFIFSILKNIKQYQNYELFFFDTKQSDGVYLDNLTQYGIFRYSKIEEYIEVFRKIIADMDERQVRLGIHSNINKYNEANPTKKMKEKIIVINEVLAIFSSLDKSEMSELAGYLVNILAKGAATGIKMILISQSARKDIDPNFAKILANIQTKFLLKLNNAEEIEIVSRGFSKEDSAKVKNIMKYNCFYTEESEIKQEFRAYNLDQEKLLSWIKNNFEISKFFDNKEINDYYIHAKNTNNLNLKEASNPPFNLNREKRNFLINSLEKKGEIVKEVGKAIYFKNKD